MDIIFVIDASDESNLGYYTDYASLVVNVVKPENGRVVVSSFAFDYQIDLSFDYHNDDILNSLQTIDVLSGSSNSGNFL